MSASRCYSKGICSSKTVKLLGNNSPLMLARALCDTSILLLAEIREPEKQASITNNGAEISVSFIAVFIQS